MAAHAQGMGLDPRKPFGRAEARRAGIPLKHLSSARFRKLFHDVYVGAEVAVSPALRASAVLGISPAGSHASHHTAAQIWGGIVPDQPLTHVSSPRGSNRSERQGVGSHRTVEGSDVVTFCGVRVSSPVQTFIDLAGDLSLVDLVVLGDSLVRNGRTTLGDLVAATRDWSGAGCRAAARAGALVRAGVDSPMETRLRLLMVFAGLPEPVVNHIVHDERGNVTKRFDLSYPELRLLIEYDGRHHAESQVQWDRDIQRREELDIDGWRLIIVQSRGIYQEPATTLQRIVDVMRERGARNVPRTLNPEWQRHFHGR